MRYRLEVRITAADVGKRVTIRWRPAELDGSKLMTDVLGILEEADEQFFKVRRDREPDGGAAGGGGLGAVHPL
jgi:hypothetical protein